MADTGKNAETVAVLRTVCNILEDGHKGFAHIGEHLKDETLKRYFMAESLKREQFKGDLEAELHRQGISDVDESGTTAGALHRTWGELKANVLGVSDHELLATAEQGEDAAKKAYAEALKAELPLPVHQMLSTQQAHVITAHDYVRNNRDALAKAA